MYRVALSVMVSAAVFAVGCKEKTNEAKPPASSGSGPSAAGSGSDGSAATAPPANPDSGSSSVTPPPAAPAKLPGEMWPKPFRSLAEGAKFALAPTVSVDPPPGQGLELTIASVSDDAITASTKDGWSVTFQRTGKTVQLDGDVKGAAKGDHLFCFQPEPPEGDCDDVCDGTVCVCAEHGIVQVDGVLGPTVDEIFANKSCPHRDK